MRIPAFLRRLVAHRGFLLATWLLLLAAGSAVGAWQHQQVRQLRTELSDLGYRLCLEQGLADDRYRGDWQDTAAGCEARYPSPQYGGAFHSLWR